MSYTTLFFIFIGALAVVLLADIAKSIRKLTEMKWLALRNQR